MKASVGGTLRYCLGAYGWLLVLQWLIVEELHRLYLLFAVGRPHAWTSTFTINTLLLVAWFFFPFTLKFYREFRLPELRSRHVLVFTVAAVIFSCIQTESTQVPDLGISFLQTGPVVHDEFSYLTQADLFLQGRWYADGPDSTPELFHQMHVMNEGKFASRYLPGTAAWIVPFRYIGLEAFSGWIALAISSCLAASVVSKSSGPWGGLSAGILIATSPGMCVFSSLLLAHSPCLIGLATFLWGVQRLMDGAGLPFAFVTGVGLAFAMLCRPLTAAAVGFPFGCWMLFAGAKGILSGRPSRVQWLTRWLGTVVPLVIAFAAIAWQNYSVCGSVLKMPYAEYTRIYTPRHVFGLDNGHRGDLLRTEKTLQAYDDWAGNLDADLARSNAKNRFSACVEWTVGWSPLGIGLLVVVWSARSFTRFLSLALLSSFLLHLAHVPYWLTGILDYHYVFESGFLWLVAMGHGAGFVVDSGNTSGRPVLAICPLLFVATVGLCNQVGIYGNLAPTKAQSGVALLTQSAIQYNRFEQICVNADIQIPAIILIEPTASDLHVEYVRNPPPFDSEILVGVNRSEKYSIDDIKRLHPHRAIYTFDSSAATLNRL